MSRSRAKNCLVREVTLPFGCQIWRTVPKQAAFDGLSLTMEANDCAKLVANFEQGTTAAALRKELEASQRKMNQSQAVLKLAAREMLE